MSDQTGGLFYEMNAIYLRRKLKVILAPGHGETSPAALAALQKNLSSLGYVLDLEVCDRLRSYSSEELANFSAALVTKLQVMVGAHREYRPMYPDFPQQVMALAEAELYWNALIHYLTNRVPSQDARARPALLGGEAPKVVALGSTEDFERIFIQLAGAKSALSEEDRLDLKGFVATYRNDILRLVPGEVPVKENLAVLAAALLESTTCAAAQEWVAGRIATATDILRLAVAMSGGDPSLAEAAKFRQFRRPERRLLLSWLERCGAPTEDMLRWKGRWIRLGERLHPGEQAEKYPKAYAAFEVLRNDRPYETFNSKVERCLAAGDAGGAIQYLSSRPGELTRRLDHLLRIATDPDEVVAAFKVAAPKVSTPVVLQAMGHFAHRDEPQDLRTFFPKGNVGKVQAISNELPRLAAGLVGVVLAICEDALVERFAKLPPLGRCYIDPALKDFPVPFSQRSASKSLRALARGSRIPMEDWNTLRFFIWWRNGNDRTDIDLSGAFFDKAFNYVDVISYYSLRNSMGHHSGDIVDAPKGAAEFFDLDLEAARKKGVRYVVMSVNSFTAQPYCDLPECFAGWMGRAKPDSGEIFEARTVLNKVDLTANTRTCLPAIFDIEARQVIWADVALAGAPYWNNVANNLSGVALMLRALLSLEKPTLEMLFRLHVKARGIQVASREEAKMVFSPEAGVTPFDIPMILAEYL